MVPSYGDDIVAHVIFGVAHRALVQAELLNPNSPVTRATQIPGRLAQPIVMLVVGQTDLGVLWPDQKPTSVGAIIQLFLEPLQYPF